MKRIISLLLVLMMAVSLFPAVHAGSAPAVSSNIDDHFYVNVQRWTDPIRSTLACEEGGFLRVECIDDQLVVERYDADYRFLSGREIPLELPVYGGVYICDDYNFVMVGQTNYEEDDAREVFRVIRYTKDWQKVDHASIYGANTTVPFDAGCVRFDRSGDILYIRTSHEMYTSDDGLNHQANVMIAVRISDMTVTDELTRVWNSGYGYVSHSFNQFVRVDGDKLLTVDHGDFYPRSVALFQYSQPAGSETFYSRTTMVNALPIVDSSYHYNDTGVSVGGFEFSSTDYLIAGCSYDQTASTDLRYVQRNIFVTATPKDDFTDEGTTVHWLTNFTADDDVTVSPPHLLKLDTDRFFLTWTEDGVLKYCFLDGHGELDGEILTGSGDLSDCEPILADGKIVWYVTDRSAPVFHEIELNPHQHSYQAAVTAPTCTAGGYTTYTCTECGDSYVDSYTDALGHSYESHRCIRCSAYEPTLFEDVKGGDFYYEPVFWAVENNITNGMDATHFGPNASCNRAQVVTFLWRAVGCPEPEATYNPFVDVQKGSFYEKAVLWAVENGITNGADAAHFDPNAACNRAAVVTFLWRTSGMPDPVTSLIPFVDVPEGSWFANPVIWAVENGVTNGISATEFGANTACNRAQVVTFLYRAKDLLKATPNNPVNPENPIEPENPTEPDIPSVPGINIPPSDPNGTKYILNLSTKKFHYPSCFTVVRIDAENYYEFIGWRADLIEYDYSPCGHCDP